MRVRLENPPWDYVNHWRDHRWDANWIERPRLWTSATALALGAPETVCDPACGDASVVTAAHALSPIKRAILGDISPDTVAKLVPLDPGFEVDRRVADASKTLRSLDHVDAIVLTEFLEHIIDPDAVLRLARQKARWLVASSPITDGRDHTKQHYWAFDMEGYREMLEEAGWKPKAWFTANCEAHPYGLGFQVWAAE